MTPWAVIPRRPSLSQPLCLAEWQPSFPALVSAPGPQRPHLPKEGEGEIASSCRKKTEEANLGVGGLLVELRALEARGGGAVGVARHVCWGTVWPLGAHWPLCLPSHSGLETCQ